MSVGQELRTRRTELGWDISDIASTLRIQPNYLEGIEAEDFRELPGGAYTIGFVKTYARALGLDQDEIAVKFRREQASAVQVAPLRIRSPIVESRVPTVSLVIIAILVAAAGWIGWAYFDSRHHPADAIPAVPERLAAPVEQLAPQTSDPGNTASPGPAVVPAISTPLIPQAAPVAAPPGSEPDEARNDTDQPGQPAGVRTTATNRDTGSGSVLGSATSPSRVEIHTSEDSWIQIRDGAHNAIYTGVMHAGDIYKLPNAPGYSFTTGNAGGVTLSVDGQVGSVLGSEGQVLRNVPIPGGTLPKQP